MLRNGTERLADLVIDAESGLIRYGGRECALEPRVMDLLRALQRNRGRVVSRDELIETVWQGYPGGDAALTNAVSKLRRSLTEVGLSAACVETVPKRGYRLVGDPSGPETPRPAARPRAGRLLPAAVAAASLLVLAMTAWWLWPGGAPTRVAIFPLAAADGVDSQRAEGVTREVVSRLASLSDIELVFIDFTADSTNPGSAQLASARRIDADYFLVGEIASSASAERGATMRLAARLVRARDGRSTWQGVLESTPGSLSTLQVDLAEALAGVLTVDIADSIRPAGDATPDDEAYRLYLDALGEIRAGFLPYTGDQVKRAYFLLRRAVDLDPTFARAWARLAVVLAGAPSLFTDADLTATEALARAQALAPDTADTLIAEGSVLLSPAAPALDARNVDRALDAYLTALASRPNSVRALRGASRSLGMAGQARLATGFAEAALRRAPNDPVVLAVATDANLAERNWSRALTLARRWAEEASQYEYPWLVMARATLLKTGDARAAQEVLDDAPPGLVSVASRSEIDAYAGDWYPIVERAARVLAQGGPAAAARSPSLSPFSIVAYREVGDAGTAARIADALIERMQGIEARTPGNIKVINGLTTANLFDRRTADALLWACRALAWARDRGQPAHAQLHGLARVAAVSGWSEEAIALAGPLLEASYWTVPGPLTDVELGFPIWDSLRGEDGFARLLARAEALHGREPSALDPGSVEALVALARDRAAVELPDFEVAERLCAQTEAPSLALVDDAGS